MKSFEDFINIQNDNEYILLKSKDDLTLEHNKNSTLFEMTGFLGTAGEAIIDKNNNITLFVDPRYHLQADSQTKGRNVKVIKLDMKTSLAEGLKNTLKAGDTLYIPAKSTRLSTLENFQKTLKNIKIKPYSTKDIKSEKSIIETVSPKICGTPYNKKIEKLKKAIKNKNIFISNPEDVSYLLNLRCYKTENTSVIKAKMLILGDKAYVFTNDIMPALKEIKTLPLNKLDTVLSSTNEEILVDKNTITINDYNLIKKPTTLRKNPISKMASLKNKYEIEHFKDSFKKLDNALYNFRNKTRVGLTEFELKEIFEDELIKNGAKCTSFKTILAVDKNSSSIHYSSYDKDKKIKDGDILLIDCGGYYEGGYATDITRVFLCGKEPRNDKIKEIYTAVLRAQLNVYFNDFEDTSSMDDCARKILQPYEKQGFLFPHSLGHGVGIPVHQAPPTLTPNPTYNCKLQNNMVFTIEPGLYKENDFGIRLENTVYFDKKSNKKISLSKFPYEENLINKNMLTKKELKWLNEWQTGASQNDEAIGR